MIQTRPDIRTEIRSASRRESTNEVVLVCACDEQYAMPLTVMLYSAARRLSAGNHLSVYFLDGGLSEGSWTAIKESLIDLPIDIFCIQPDYSLVENLATSHHVTPAAYLRLLTAELMPPEVDRAIYIDADILVCDDLAKLWDTPLENRCYCAAAPDIACPYVDARLGCPNFRRSNPYMAAHRPIPNYRDLGLEPQSMYFNSGVMLMNLDLWRKDDVARKMLLCLDQNSKHVWCWDQYALNVVFHGRWQALPARWNQGAHALEYPNCGYSPIDRDEFRLMLRDPGIVHFTTEFKPWHYDWMHLRGELFFKTLDQTSYRGWRPEKPEYQFNKWMLRTTVSFIKRLTISSRQVASIWS